MECLEFAGGFCSLLNDFAFMLRTKIQTTPVFVDDQVHPIVV